MSRPKGPLPGGQHFVAGPLDFNSLGQFGQAANGSWAKLPTYYYDLIRSQAPVTEAEFNSKYGAVIDIFGLGSQQEDRQSNAGTSASVTEVFCAVGASIVAVGEGEAFAVPGATVATPDAGSDTPAINSCVDVRTGTNAILQWGSPIWTAFEKMFLGYRFRMLSSRFVLVDELLQDIGMSPAPPEFIGAGDMNVSAMPGIRDTNDVLLAKNFDFQFFPQNVVTDEEETLACVGPPLVPAMKGHPRILGMSKRMFCFNHPICFFPGMQFQVDLYQQDALLVDQARQSLQVRSDVPSARVVEAIDGAATLSSRVVTIPGGTMHLGVILKGFALQPQAALDYLTAYLPRLSGSWRDLYANNTWLGNLILQTDRAARAGGAGGIRGLLGKSDMRDTEKQAALEVIRQLSGNALDG